MKVSGSQLNKDQSVKFTRIADGLDMTVTIRHDDRCNNGHNTFSITMDAYTADKPKTDRFMEFCGCAHDVVAKHFPELTPLIKWHLCSTDGPMYYIPNTLYHASNKDCRGLKAGEYNSFNFQIVIGDTVLFTSRVFYSFRDWLHRDDARKETESFFENIKPELNPKIITVGSGEPSKGKDRDIDAARSSSIWPDATIEQLQDKQALTARLPGLMAEFRTAVESVGLTY